MDLCNICNRYISSHSCKLKCFACKCSFHLTCITGLTKNDFRSLSNFNWMCKLCTMELFPFNHIEDDDIFSNIISDQCNIPLSLAVDELEKEYLIFLKQMMSMILDF